MGAGLQGSVVSCRGPAARLERGYEYEMQQRKMLGEVQRKATGGALCDRDCLSLFVALLLLTWGAMSQADASRAVVPAQGLMSTKRRYISCFPVKLSLDRHPPTLSLVVVLVLFIPEMKARH